MSYSLINSDTIFLELTADPMSLWSSVPQDGPHFRCQSQVLDHQWKWKSLSCVTLCDPMDSPWNSTGQNTGVGSRFLLQGIFRTQGSNLGLPHCRWILYQLSHQGSPWPQVLQTNCIKSRVPTTPTLDLIICWNSLKNSGKYLCLLTL